MNMDIG